MLVASCNGMLRGLDGRTGAVRWSYDANRDGGHPGFHGRWLVTRDRVFIGSDDRSPDGVGYLYAFRRPGLDLAWKRRLGPGVMTDIVEYAGSVFAVTLWDELVSVDRRTGDVRWTVASGASNERFVQNATPALAGSRVIFGGLNGDLVAVDARSGAGLWRVSLGKRVSTSVAVDGDAVYAAEAGGRVVRVDAATGARGAELRLTGTPFSRLAVAGASLLTFVNENEVVVLKALALALDSVRWSQSVPGPGWSSFAWPYISRGWVVAGGASGEFAAMGLADGVRRWGGKVTGAIAGIGGDSTTLYVGTTAGVLYAWALPASAR